MNQSDHQLAANTIRALTMDAVEAAGNGHPGMPMGTADIAVVLWKQFLKHNPAVANWPDRDRFVQSAGHGSMLIYSLLHLSGYALTLDDLRNYRQWGSKTPGHPEYGHTPGVETTTGPLGQGVSTAVGLALAERMLAARFNRPGYEIVDHHTYVIASDGDLMEGVSHEAGSLAGHLGLGKLIVLYDDNGISIDGPTSLAFSEDIPARFAAYGWHTLAIDGHDQAAIAAALTEAQAVTDRPTLIAARTHIGFGSPHKQDTASAHGSRLGAEEVALTKRALGLAEDAVFHVPEEVYAYMGSPAAGGAAAQSAWNERFATYARAFPELASEYRRVLKGELPADWEAALPHFESGAPLATRASSGKVLTAIADRLPELVGGSADLTGSNMTLPAGAASVSRDNYGGRYLHFGIREHGMGAILNGLALHGGFRPYGGTFLVFSDYMRPAIRLAALMKLPVIYVFSHDSIGLGEDGPTHQPIEHLMSLRAIPNLVVVRPGDARETAAAWRAAISRRDGPTALILSRQSVPTLEEALDEGVLRGGYVLREMDNPQALLLATGTELPIALEAQAQLAAQGVAARVVSLPSLELFAAQPAGYRDSVLPPEVTVRVAIEAGSTQGWERYVGSGTIIGLDHYGASAPYETLYREFGLTAEAVVAAVLAQL